MHTPPGEAAIKTTLPRSLHLAHTLEHNQGCWFETLCPGNTSHITPWPVEITSAFLQGLEQPMFAKNKTPPN